MKSLLLIRHAKSSWNYPELSDFERPLNKRGKRDAPHMGNVLKNLSIKLDLILTSSAVRAYATAKIIAKSLGYPKEKIKKDLQIYQAEEVELFKIIRKLPDELNTVALIGHNPAMTELINLLIITEIENHPTCGIIKINFPSSSWKEISRKTGTVEFNEYPKKYFIKEEN